MFKNINWISSRHSLIIALYAISSVLVLTTCTKYERDSPFDPGAQGGPNQDTLNLLLEYNPDCKEAIDVCVDQAKADSIQIFIDNVKANSAFQFTVTSLNGRNDTVGSPNILLSGTLTLDNDLRTFEINNKVVSLTGSVWSINLLLTEGQNEIAVLLRDDQSNLYEIPILIFYSVTAADNEAPVVEYTSKPGLFVTEKNISLQGTLLDATGIKSFTINNIEVSVTAGVWLYSDTLIIGENLIVIKAVDTAPSENTFSDTLIIQYSLTDEQAPNLKILDPLTAAVLDINVDVSVSGTATDESGILNVIVNGDSATINHINHEWSAKVDLLPGPTSTITAIATDSAGNKDTASITVEYDPTADDITPPTIDMVSPSDTNKVLSDSVIFIQFKIEDNSGIQSVTINGVKISTNDSGFYSLEDTLTEGPNNEYIVIATDASSSNNFKSQTFNLKYSPEDITAPVITLISPADSSIHDSNSITIRVQVVEDKSGIAGVLIGSVNATHIEGPDNFWEATFQFNEPGKYYVPVIAQDQPGNVDTVIYTFFYDPSRLDFTPPVITFSENSIQPYVPSTAIYDTVYTDSVFFEFSVEDDYPKIFSFVGETEDTTNVAIPVFNEETAKWQATLPLDSGFSAFVLLVVDGSSNQNRDTTVFAVYRGVPLDSISINSVMILKLEQDQFTKQPDIDWHPSNATNQKYFIRETQNTNYQFISISTDKQSITGIDFEGPLKSTEAEIVPEADSTKAKLIFIQLD